MSSKHKLGRFTFVQERHRPKTCLEFVMHVQRLNSCRKRFMVFFFLIRKSGWHAAKKAKTRFNSQTTTSLLKIKLSIQIRWDAHKSGKAVLGSIMTLLTLLLIMLTDLLAWEHIKTLQPPFTRCFRYKKGRFEIWTGSHKNRVGFKDDDQFGWGK